MAEFLMPSLGADMEAATVVQWLVAPGDRVERGQIVVQVETEKGVLDVEIFESGVIDKILVGEGERVPVGTVLATLSAVEAEPQPKEQPEPRGAPVRAPAAAAPRPKERAAPPRVPSRPLAVAREPEPGPAEIPRQQRHRRRISPAARTLAETEGIDLGAIEGTGPDEAVTLSDVRRAIAAAAAKAEAATKRPVGAEREERRAAPQPVQEEAAPAVARKALAEPEPEAEGARPLESAAETDRLKRQRAAMRASIAALMARSKREIPHYYLSEEIDMHAALAWLETENQQRPVQDRILPAALLLKASALAARDVPEMNGFFVEGAFRPSEAVHLGVAISLRGAGLIAPAIHDADRKTLPELMTALRDLVKRARAGGLRASEMSDPTITVTNLGEQGVVTVFGVIYPPQVALVGFGKIVERASAVSGMLAVRPVVSATLAADHRVSDGHRGGLFLATIARLLQQPEAL